MLNFFCSSSIIIDRRIFSVVITISKIGVGERMQGEILYLIHKYDGISRQEISNRLSVNKATISNITTELLESGVISEVGYGTGTQRGRKRIQLEINYKKMFVIGVGIVQGVLQYGLLTLNGEVVESAVKEIDESNYFEMLELIVQTVKEIINNNKIEKEKIIGIGIAYDNKMSVDYDIKSDKLQKEIQYGTAIKTVASTTINAMAVGQLIDSGDVNEQDCIYIKADNHSESIYYINNRLYNAQEFPYGTIDSMMTNRTLEQAIELMVNVTGIQKAHQFNNDEVKKMVYKIASRYAVGEIFYKGSYQKRK